MTRTIFTLNDLRAAFDGTYPTTLSAELYDRAKREGYEMVGYVRANYSRLTPAEIAQEDDELYSNSRAI